MKYLHPEDISIFSIFFPQPNTLEVIFLPASHRSSLLPFFVQTNNGLITFLAHSIILLLITLFMQHKYLSFLIIYLKYCPDQLVGPAHHGTAHVRPMNLRVELDRAKNVSSLNFVAPTDTLFQISKF